MTASTSLLDRHIAFMARWTGNRQTLTTPCCDRALEVVAPSEPGEIWDSLTECPYCGEMFFHVVAVDSARGYRPSDAKGSAP